VLLAVGCTFTWHLHLGMPVGAAVWQPTCP
jgi:hypothetical protein